jgi:hypothetical protein
VAFVWGLVLRFDGRFRSKIELGLTEEAAQKTGNELAQRKGELASLEQSKHRLEVGALFR